MLKVLSVITIINSIVVEIKSFIVNLNDKNADEIAFDEAENYFIKQVKEVCDFTYTEEDAIHDGFMYDDGISRIEIVWSI